DACFRKITRDSLKIHSLPLSEILLNVPKKRSNIYNLSQLFFQLLAGFFLDGFPHLRLAFIEELLTFRHAYLELDPATFPVDRGDNKSHAFLGRLLLELFDLLS